MQTLTIQFQLRPEQVARAEELNAEKAAHLAGDWRDYVASVAQYAVNLDLRPPTGLSNVVGVQVVKEG